jgi:hypothetical protein
MSEDTPQQYRVTLFNAGAMEGAAQVIDAATP